MSKDTARLFVGGFPSYTTKDELEQLCSRFGKVLSVDIFPHRRFGFVTFSSKNDATLALYGLQRQTLKGMRLEVDWAKAKREQERNNNKTEKEEIQQVVPTTKPKVEEDNSNNSRYIPGSDTESAILATKSNGVKAKKPKQKSNLNVTSAPPSKSESNDGIERKYSEYYPELEVTIRDIANHELKYQFRVKSLSALKQFLVDEGEGIEPSQLLLASTPSNDKSQVTYNGAPVVYVYEDSLRKEMLEARENKNQREKNILEIRKRKIKIPEARVPLSEKNILSSELHQLLAQKGYQKVYINTSSINGVLAPLHPSWRPTPNSHSYRKGNAIISFVVQDTHVISCEFYQSTNNTYKDLLPLLTKYDICIFNVTKQAFITPEQLK